MKYKQELEEILDNEYELELDDLETSIIDEWDDDLDLYLSNFSDNKRIKIQEDLKNSTIVEIYGNFENKNRLYYYYKDGWKEI